MNLSTFYTFKDENSYLSYILFNHFTQCYSMRLLSCILNSMIFDLIKLMSLAFLLKSFHLRILDILYYSFLVVANDSLVEECKEETEDTRVTYNDG